MNSHKDRSVIYILCLLFLQQNKGTQKLQPSVTLDDIRSVKLRSVEDRQVRSSLIASCLHIVSFPGLNTNIVSVKPQVCNDGLGMKLDSMLMVCCILYSSAPVAAVLVPVGLWSLWPT